MQRRFAVTLVSLACVACSHDAPRDPPSARVSIEPDFGAALHRDPEAGLPFWKRSGTVVQDDERDAIELPSGVELTFAIPLGARRVESALATLEKPAQSEDRAIRIELTLVAGESRKTLLVTSASSIATHGAWQRLTAAIDPPAPRGARLAVRATIALAAGAAPTAPTTLEFERPSFDAPHADQLNVLVISIDTLRADHLGCFGYSRPTSPRIDALAKQGVLFSNCTSAAPWTEPSYGTLFTSRSPIVHRAGINPAREEKWGSDEEVPAKDQDQAQDLSAGVATWAEMLRTRGLETAGFHSNPFLRARTGIDRGFERWIFYRHRANAGVGLALDWIDSRGKNPWFAFLHIVDPHQPYSPPSPWDRKWAVRGPETIEGFPLRVDTIRALPEDPEFRKLWVDLYDGEIGFTDEQVGRLLDTLQASGALAHTLIVLQADHGEEFWDHGGYEHGETLYEEVAHVPLIFVCPSKIPAGVRVKERVSLIDVLPTVLALVGAPIPKDLEGIDLAPLWSGKSVAAREILCDTLLYGAREQKSLCVGAEKLVVESGRAPRLFDLELDPREKHDFAPERAARVAELKAHLDERVKLLRDAAQRSHLSEMSAGTVRDLRNLGYTAGHGGDDEDKEPGGEKKDKDKH